jgi:hypothetical protein
VLIELSGRLGRADWRDYWLRLVPSLPGTTVLPHSESDADSDRHLADHISYSRRHIPSRPIPESARHPRLSLSSSFRPHYAIPFTSNLRVSRVGARVPDPLLADRADMRSLRPTRSSLNSKIRLGYRPRRQCGTLHGVDRIDDRLGGRPSLWTRSSRPGDDEDMSTFARKGLARRGVRVCGQDGSRHAESRPVPSERSDQRGGPFLLIQCRAEELIPQDELDKQPTIGELMASGKEAPRVKQMAQPMLPHVRFGSDKRLAEVERIMQTTRARTISVHDPKVAG